MVTPMQRRSTASARSGSEGRYRGGAAGMDRLERGSNFVRTLVAAIARFSSANERSESDGHDGRHRCRWLVEDPRGQLESRRRGERQAPGRQLIEHDAKGPEIGSVIRDLGPKLLRGHIRQRADRRAWLRQRGSRLHVGVAAIVLGDTTGQSEIQHLARPSADDDDVGALQIPMDNMTCVRMSQGIGNLYLHSERGAHR